MVMGDLDRRKHDVDIIERVLGGMRDPGSDAEGRTRVIDVEVPWVSGTHSTLELTIGIDDSVSDRRRRR
jgi:hypothetical protein